MKTIYVGYSLEEEQTGETGYAAVGAWLSVHHNSVSRVAHVKAMTAGCPEGWKLVAIDDPKNNATLCRVQPMSSFLGNTNHIVALEEYFVGLIKNLDDFANANPELDWKAQGE